MFKSGNLMNPIIYLLHSGNLYGTERMALATMTGLGQQGLGVLVAPPGPVHAEAARLGLVSLVFKSVPQLLRHLTTLLRQYREASIVATGVSHSLAAHAIAALLRTRIRHLHVIHGGTDERLSYGRKALLAHIPVTLVAVSRFVRERLLAHGCDPASIRVIENFLPDSAGPTPSGSPRQLRRVAVVSRLDPIKRVGLLLDAITLNPALRALEFDVFGEGSELEALRKRCESIPNVRLLGFQPDAAARLRDYDLYLHTCAEEPFGIAILEAMTGGVPVLVPNAGGAGELVEDGKSGFHFPANCSKGLANRLASLCLLSSQQLAPVVAAAHAQLATRFSPQRGLAEYAALLGVSTHA